MVLFSRGEVVEIHPQVRLPIDLALFMEVWKEVTPILTLHIQEDLETWLSYPVWSSSLQVQMDVLN